MWYCWNIFQRKIFRKNKVMQERLKHRGPDNQLIIDIDNNFALTNTDFLS